MGERTDYAETRYGFRYGPLEVQRTASGPRIGYVVTVRLPDGERVEVRTSRTGRSGLSVRHVLFAGEAAPPMQEEVEP